MGEERARCGMQLGAEPQKPDLGHGRQSAEVPARARGILATTPGTQGAVRGRTARWLVLGVGEARSCRAQLEVKGLAGEGGGPGGGGGGQ